MLTCQKCTKECKPSEGGRCVKCHRFFCDDHLYGQVCADHVQPPSQAEREFYFGDK